GDSLYRNAAWPRIPPRPAGRISAFPHPGWPAQGRLARHQGPHPVRLAAQPHTLPQTAAPVPSRRRHWRRRLRFRPSYGRGDPYGNPHSRLEPNAFPGLANRLVGKRVKAAAVNFATAEKYFRNPHLTGIPVRKEFFRLQPRPSAAPPHLLVFGGSQGARILNNVM